jgi:hypothetical protein
MNLKKLAYWGALFGALLFLSSNVYATTYYVAANGSDSNSGTSKSSPWLHAHGMTGCSGNCLAHVPQPGDSFVFRGCDSWHNTGNPGGLPWFIGYSGSAGSPLYFGGGDETWSSGNCANSGIVDTNGTQVLLAAYGESTVGTASTPFVAASTWNGGTSSWVGGSITINGVTYTIASVQNPYQLTLTTSAGVQRSVPYSNTLWGRPILNMDSTLFSSGSGSMVQANSQRYINFDMWEVKGMYWNDSTQGNSFLQFVAAQSNTPEYVVLSNLYIHGWSHAASTASTNPQASYMIWQGSNGNVAIGQEDAFIDIDGSDSLDSQFYGSSGLVNCSSLGQYPEGKCATASGIGFEGYNIHDTRIKYTANAVIINNPHLFYNNIIERTYNCFQKGNAMHGNGWEFNGEYYANNLFYNNVTRLNTVAVTTWINPPAGYTDYIFNNIWYANGQQDLDQCSKGGGPVPACGSGPDGGQAVFYNNTFALVTIGNGVGAPGYSTFENNFWITANGASAAHGTETFQLALTPSAAASHGFTAANAYAPTTAGAPTVGTGTTTLASTCLNISPALCSDTNAGDTRNPVARPSGSAWDKGAFQFNGASTVASAPPPPTKPEPPTSLSAVIQ